MFYDQISSASFNLNLYEHFFIHYTGTDVLVTSDVYNVNIVFMYLNCCLQLKVAVYSCTPLMTGETRVSCCQCHKQDFCSVQDAHLVVWMHRIV